MYNGYSSCFAYSKGAASVEKEEASASQYKAMAILFSCGTAFQKPIFSRRKKCSYKLKTVWKTPFNILKFERTVLGIFLVGVLFFTSVQDPLSSCSQNPRLHGAHQNRLLSPSLPRCRINCVELAGVVYICEGQPELLTE